MTTTKQEFLADMKRLEDLSRNYDFAVIQLCAVGFAPEAKIFEAADRAFMALADMIADKHGIHRDSLACFIYENAFGKKQFKCKKDDGEEIKIKNAADFWRFENGGTK